MAARKITSSIHKSILSILNSFVVQQYKYITKTSKTGFYNHIKIKSQKYKVNHVLNQLFSLRKKKKLKEPIYMRKLHIR